MLSLADQYRNGEGTEINLEKAFYWQQKAAESTKENFKNTVELCDECKQPYIGYQCYYDKGGFSEIHKAIWSDGPIDSWNSNKQQWNRWNFQSGYEVILKILNDSSSLNSKSLDEVIVYVFNVMSYAKKGNIRQCLSGLIKLKWHDKLQLLKKIILGLKVIHETNLTHGDFHDGNILISDNHNENTPKCYINLMKKCWDSNPENRPAITEIEHKLSEWIRCIDEYYQINRNVNYNLKVPNVDSKSESDMLEFVEANNYLEQEQACDTIIVHSCPQAYYMSRELTEIRFKEDSDYLEYMI
ncbi:kinase-like domain-containing protein [Rhizophagus clarus]|uniref:Kinase-like domain-containing protein n=1 Tax=Rhizophagus clarus TaxID=94130 RepID=A0A8H3QLL8_9GLOM|nr:kinase-like domain-containing protein [Rhizophagus clarus]